MERDVRYLAGWLSGILEVEVVHPAATVSKSEERDGVGVAVSMGVLHRRRLGEGHLLSKRNELIRYIARKGRHESYGAAGAIVVEAHESKRLSQIGRH